MAYNPERKTWRGRSYKKGGQRVRALRDAAVADGHEPETLAEEQAESAYLNLPAPAAEFVEGYHGCEDPHCGCQQPERHKP